MVREQAAGVEQRRMTGNLYGLRGWYQGGRCVDQLVVGDVVTVGRNARGETCIFLRGREYPADLTVLADLRARSVPA